MNQLNMNWVEASSTSGGFFFVLPLQEFVKLARKLTSDIYTPKGQVRPRLIIRKANTKGKLVTKSIPVIEDLRQLLSNYYPIRGDVYLFPGRSNGHLAEDNAALVGVGVMIGHIARAEVPQALPMSATEQKK